MRHNRATRRRFLHLAGGTAAVSLAGCLSSEDDMNDDAPGGMADADAMDADEPVENEMDSDGA